MKAIILAAGYATRLYPLTREYPKSLLQVKNKAILDYIIDKLEAIGGLNEIIIVTNSKFIAKFRQWKKKTAVKKKLSLVDDRTRNNSDRLGAIGDINFVLNKKRIKEDILVIGGDNLFSAGLAGFLKFAFQKKPGATIGLYKLKDIKDAYRYGVAKLDKEKRVIHFEEKPGKPQSRLVAMCLYYIPFERLGLIKEYMKVTGKTDATGNYIDWLKERIEAYGFIFHGAWYDIGDLKYLTRAEKYFA